MSTYNLNLDNFATFEITFKGKKYILQAPSLDNAVEFELLFDEFFNDYKRNKKGEFLLDKDKKKIRKSAKEVVADTHAIMDQIFMSKEEADEVLSQMNMVQSMRLVRYVHGLFIGNVNEDLKQETE